MKEFLLVFRNSVSADEKPSAEQMQGMMKLWQDWMGSIAAQNKLVSSGSRLSSAIGKVVKPKGIITEGPYAEIKEAIGGYIIIGASSVDEAAEMAKGCPILLLGGNVEVREQIAMGDNS